MTNRKALEADLDGGPWLTLLALADLCEEEGDLDSAAGYRWLVAWKKEPHSWGAGGSGGWQWAVGQCELTPGDRPGRGLPVNHWKAGTKDDLPRVGALEGQLFVNSRSRSEAYRKAAKLIGRWLRGSRNDRG